ncbi:MAG: hypothetical protein LBQ75_00740 [Zoogloeaceae bacterium]|nr:hypothetical protein [Zoogloeaceae bacterium]
MKAVSFFLHAARARFFRGVLVLCSCFCLMEAVADSHPLVVESAEERARMKESWKRLSHEERDELRHQMRTAWQPLSQEEHERLREECRRSESGKKEGKKKEGKRDSRSGGFRNDRPESREDRESRKEERCVRRARWHKLSPEEQESFRSKLHEMLRQKETPAGDGRPEESLPVKQPVGAARR